MSKTVNISVANVIEEGRWGGPQKRICLVAEALKAYDVKTTIFFPRYDSDIFKQALEKADLDYESLMLHRLGRGLVTLALYTLTFIPEIILLYRKLRKGQFDIVHVSGGAWQIKGIIAAKLAGLPVIWHLNDTSMPDVLVMLFRRLGKLASGFFYAAIKTQNYYLQFDALSGYPGYLVPAPVDTVKYNPDSVSPDSLTISYPGPRLITVCSVNPIKGIEVLIDAVNILRQQSLSFSLLIIGPIHSSQSNYYDSLCKKILSLGLDQEVHFLGAKSNIAEQLSSADIYICSSHAEASPLSVWEAMSMELPVVSTDVGDVSQYIDSGKNGVLVSPGDAISLAKELQKLMKDSDLRNRLGHLARQTVCQYLDTTVIAEITAKAYRDVLDRVNIVERKSNV